MSFGGAADSGWRGAKRFGDVMKRLLKAKRFYQKSRYGPLVAAWEEVAGEEIASRTQIGSYEHGRLTIRVDSSVLLHELASFMKDMLLRQLRQQAAGRDVVDLRFCLGGGARRSTNSSSP